MSVDSTSSSNVSLHPSYSFFSDCFGYVVSNNIFITFTVTNIILLLPLSIVVLHLGHQQWRQQRSASTSHSDLITYHMVVMEMVYIFASIFYCIGVYIELKRVMLVASHVFFITLGGQMSFHILTCVEHYLAVVHPITYMHLRKGSRLRIRNILIWSIWLLGFAHMSFIVLNTIDIIVTVYLGQQVFSLAAVSFCSLAVLRVLKRPGPGEGGGARERSDQSKQKAFNAIMAIMGTLLLRFGGSLVCTAIYAFQGQMSDSDGCVVIVSSYWFCLPSSLVLPLLFLHRTGKLPCCRNNMESGQGSS